MRNVVVLLWICLIALTLTGSSHSLVDDVTLLKKRVDDLQAEVNFLKKSLNLAEKSETKKDNAREVSSLKEDKVETAKRDYAFWKDPRRPMLVDEFYLNKKSIPEDNENDKDKRNDLLLKLLVRALQDNK